MMRKIINNSQFPISNFQFTHHTRHLPPLILFLLWLSAILGLPTWLPTQPASWVAFLAFLITPGWFLTDLITWRMRHLDTLERLAIAFPLGIVVLALPGTYAFANHLTIDQLVAGWTLTALLVIVAWLIHGFLIRTPTRLFDSSRHTTPWSTDQLIFLFLILIAFVALLPTITLDKIDGDAYAVATFSADGLAGLPLNAVEPLFGTDIGPGVRMMFNQFLTMNYLWTDLSGVDPITLTAVASRPVLALWALFASYTLGKSAGKGNRRTGLFVAAIQLLIYAVSPFIRGDNVSLFYFERTNADKFMVPITMLPVVFACAMHFLRSGRKEHWIIASLTAFAVSTIHPLIAAMLTLAIGAFGGFHVLMSLERRKTEDGGRGLGRWPLAVGRWRLSASGQRLAAIAAIAIIAMSLPILQLVLSRGEEPLASSYPRSFEGWQVAEREIQALPFWTLPSLQVYGHVPEIGEVEAEDANSSDNPFLVWRFSVNMNRRRIILFDLNQYISDPSLIMEPPYMLSVLLLPVVFWKRRKDVAAQFVVAVTIAVLMVMYNPYVTPLIGSLVMPWILWRFVWLLPYALAIALALERVASFVVRGLANHSRTTHYVPRTAPAYALLGLTLILTFVSQPLIAQNVKNLHDRAVSPYYYPNPAGIISTLNQRTTQSSLVLADADLSVTIPAYVANAAILAHRPPTTSEIFPAPRQAEALQRLIDQDYFFNTPYLTNESVAILQRYDVRFIVVDSGSQLDQQLSLAPHWFTHVTDDQSYSLYEVGFMPAITASTAGNSALSAREWEEAEAFFSSAPAEDLLAQAGMAELAHARGQFDTALSHLQRVIAQQDTPALQYQLGRLYSESGRVVEGIEAFQTAISNAPTVPRYYVALGNACLTIGDEVCAEQAYHTAASHEQVADEAIRTIAEADMWRQQRRLDRAIPLYEQAVATRPGEYNQFILESAYREAGRFAEADALLLSMHNENPLSAEILTVQAISQAQQGQFDDAIDLYEEAISLQVWQAQDSHQTRLALAELLLSIGRVEQASVEIEQVISAQPHNATAYRLRGDVFNWQGNYEPATNAYQRAYELDPTQVTSYLALSSQLQERGGNPAGLLNLLQATIDANPNEPVLYMALGDQLTAEGNHRGAISAYQNALERFSAYNLGSTIRRQPNSESRAVAYARLGRAYENLGELDPALNYYQAAVASVPNTGWSQVMLANALRRSNETDLASAIYGDVTASDPAFTTAQTSLADIYIENGNFSEAEALLTELLDEDNTLLNPYIRLGELASQQGDFDTALDWYRQAADLPIDNQSVNLTLIDALVRLGDRLTARRYVNSALDIRPTDPELMLRLGRIQRLEGQYTLAEQTLTRARNLQPQDSRYLAELAEVFVGQGLPLEALVIYEQAASLQPGLADYPLTMAEILLGQGQTDGAVQVLKDSLAEVSRPERIYTALSNLYVQLGQFSLAEETLIQGMAQEGESVELLLALGRFYMARADISSAAKQFDRASKLDATEPGVFVAFGDLAWQQGQEEEALAFYRQAVEVAPNDVSGHVALGVAYGLLARPGEAITAYENALILAPDFENIYLSLADLYGQQGQIQLAQRMYERALIFNSGSGQLLTEYAIFLVGRGTSGEAVTLLDTAVEFTPKAEVFVARSALMVRLNRPGDALTDLQTALAIEPGSIPALLALGDLYTTQADYTNAEQAYSQLSTLTPGLPTSYLRLGNLASLQGDVTRANDFAVTAQAVAPTITIILNTTQQ